MASTDYNRFASSDSTDSMHPIQRLCPEILAEIFTYCLPDMPKEREPLECISNRKAPLLLCSVCSSWRSLSISTPRLWQTLHLKMSISDERLMIDIESTISGIRTWLARSGGLPLSIRAAFWIINRESDQPIKCRRILEVLLQEMSRWESFELHDRGLWVTPPHFGILPILHTFNISKSRIDELPFTAAPHLKRLGLYCYPNRTSVSAIPWDQLVELTIWKFLPISMAAEVIQHCPRLESLWLRVEEGHEDGSGTFTSRTQHDTLQKLHLIGLPNIIIDRLTLPALSDLSLRTDSSMPEIGVKIRCSQLLALFTLSNCELREFALYHSGFGSSELLECLSHQSCQTLTRLVIHDDEYLPPTVDGELLVPLTYRDVDDDVPLCPKLRHLELDGCYCSDRSFPDVLGRMIQSRCFGRTQDTQLRTLLIFNRDPISKEDHELLQIAQSNGGLKLTYSYLPENNFNAIPGGGAAQRRRKTLAMQISDKIRLLWRGLEYRIHRR